MATQQIQVELKDLEDWDEDGVGDWLDQEDLAQYKATFKENHITGHVLPDLDDEDLQDMGIESVGHRVLLIARLQDFKAAKMISSRTEVMLRWQHYRYAPWHPFDTRRHKLTSSAIESEWDRACCGTSKQSIDISQVTDVELHGRGCAGMLYQTVTVETKDGEIHKFPVHRNRAVQVHKTIKRAWEGYQSTVPTRSVAGY